MTSIKPTAEYGCVHYKRKVKFVTPCCNNIYFCRFCHDEKETHTLNRKEVTNIICAVCDTPQYVQTYCKSCGARFGIYTCLACKLFDDEDKDQFHCTKCTICRVGGSMNYFHCSKCDICLPTAMKNNHKCIESVGKSECPICLEDIHTSRTQVHIPACGHLMHFECMKSLTKSGRKNCPLCQNSL